MSRRTTAQFTAAAFTFGECSQLRDARAPQGQYACDTVGLLGAPGAVAVLGSRLGCRLLAPDDTADVAQTLVALADELLHCRVEMHRVGAAVLVVGHTEVRRDLLESALEPAVLKAHMIEEELALHLGDLAFESGAVTDRWRQIALAAILIEVELAAKVLQHIGAVDLEQ